MRTAEIFCRAIKHSQTQPKITQWVLTRNPLGYVIWWPDMQALKKMWVRLFPSGRTALDKRRLERLLRDEGLSKSQAASITHQYFKH